MKTCGKCGQSKTLGSFSRASKNKDGLQYACKACNKLYREENRDRSNEYLRDYYVRTGRNRRIARQYKVDQDWYERTLREQDGSCAICGVEPIPGKHLFIDHDHSCCDTGPKGRRKTCGKCVRGLLCMGCNISLGHLERPDWRAKAERYLGR